MEDSERNGTAPGPQSFTAAVARRVMLRCTKLVRPAPPLPAAGLRVPLD
jgi:hypothetical protein